MMLRDSSSQSKLLCLSSQQVILWTLPCVCTFVRVYGIAGPGPKCRGRLQRIMCTSKQLCQWSVPIHRPDTYVYVPTFWCKNLAPFDEAMTNPVNGSQSLVDMVPWWNACGDVALGIQIIEILLPRKHRL